MSTRRIKKVKEAEVTTIPELARMINRSMQSLTDSMNTQFAGVKANIEGIKADIVYREEYKSLLRRVKFIEEALGLQTK